jgi:hypothetical protein
MAHADFCGRCMRTFVKKGWAVRDEEWLGPWRYRLTERGDLAVPALETLAHCPLDGMPIYRRWVEAGIARTGPSPACPYCLGKERYLLPAVLQEQLLDR